MTEDRGWRFFAHRTAWDGLELYARRGSDDIGPLTLIKRGPGETSSAFLTDSLEAIQDNVGDAHGFLRAALNCAWELGLRPDGFNDTRESMAATKAHLQDMRALAFHKIGADIPALKG